MKGIIFLILKNSSYGYVVKAIHKKTGKMCAIKRIPTDTDIEDLKQEISLMKQCDKNEYIVRYMGSYICAPENELWVFYLY